jgi:hypothetical protein
MYSSIKEEVGENVYNTWSPSARMEIEKLENQIYRARITLARYNYDNKKEIFEKTLNILEE